MRPSDVQPERLQALVQGGPSANHMEQIALDMSLLLALHVPACESRAAELSCGGLVTRMRAGGKILHETFGGQLPSEVRRSTSDTVRGWAAFSVGHGTRSLAQRLVAVRPFADDAHFAVREWAWLAVRDDVAADPAGALGLLESWALNASPRLRRFAVEATRPRSVWGRHIPALKERPEMAESLLTSVRLDRDRYVRTAVGNWINDASRTRPDWVRDLCLRWCADGASTEWVRRRGQRSLPLDVASELQPSTPR